MRQLQADLHERRRVWRERCAAMPAARRPRPVLRFAGAVRALMLCRNDFPRFARETTTRQEKLVRWGWASGACVWARVLTCARVAVRPRYCTTGARLSVGT